MCREQMGGETFEDFLLSFSTKLENPIDQYEKYVDSIMETEGIELEKCSGKKTKIGKIDGNDIFIYEISDKYIEDKKADIYIHIGGNRKKNYRISFEYNIGKMITGDFGDENINRIEHSIVYYNRILIQDKRTKLWKNMGNKNKTFLKELEKIIKLIKVKYLDPDLNKEFKNKQ